MEPSFDSPPPPRPLWTPVLGVCVVYNAWLAYRHAELNITALGWLGSFEASGVAALSLLRSVAAPAILDDRFAAGHGALVVCGAVSVLLLLLAVGGAIESALGRWASAGVFAGGCLLAVVVGAVPAFEATTAFWLGHGGLMALLGAGMVALALDGRMGGAVVAAVVVMVLAWAQGGGWVPRDSVATDMALRAGLVKPFGWNAAMIVAGAVAGFALARRRGLG